MAPTEPVVVLRPTALGALEAATMRWWLTPYWSKELSTRYSMFNAKAETIDTSASFKEPFARRRCAVPVAGYYEWSKDGERKLPYYIRPRDDDGMLLAGIWDRWRNGDEVVESFAVVTTAVHDRLAFVHRRQPVMLSRAEGRRWMDRTEDPAGAQARAVALAVAGAVERGAGEHLREQLAQRRRAVHRTHRQDDRNRRGGVVVSSMCRMFAGLALTTLLGCGDNTTVAACFGDAVFCHLSFNPRAIPGPDQTVAAGDIVTLDGSNSEPSGGIQSYSWTQTGGPSVALADANNARASFVAPSVTSDAILSFRLTVVNQTNQADTDIDAGHRTAGGNGRGGDGARVVRRIRCNRDRRLAGDGRLSVGNRGSAAGRSPPRNAGCGWRRAPSRSRRASTSNDPSAFLDASRVLVARRRACHRTCRGRSNHLASCCSARSRRNAIRHSATRWPRGSNGGTMLDDPATLLSGRSEVIDVSGIAMTATRRRLTLQRTVDRSAARVRDAMRRCGPGARR